MTKTISNTITKATVKMLCATPALAWGAMTYAFAVSVGPKLFATTNASNESEEYTVAPVCVTGKYWSCVQYDWGDPF